MHHEARTAAIILASGHYQKAVELENDPSAPLRKARIRQHIKAGDMYRKEHLRLIQVARDNFLDNTVRTD